MHPIIPKIPPFTPNPPALHPEPTRLSPRTYPPFILSLSKDATPTHGNPTPTPTQLKQKNPLPRRGRVRVGASLPTAPNTDLDPTPPTRRKMSQNAPKMRQESKNPAPATPQKATSQPSPPKLKPGKMQPNATKCNRNKKIPAFHPEPVVILSRSKDAAPTRQKNLPAPQSIIPRTARRIANIAPIPPVPPAQIQP